MKAVPICLAAGALLVTGCTPTEKIRFNSKQEEACYRQVSAQLGPNQRLQRDRNGVFVRVTSTEGFVDDVDRSPEFEACMVADQVPGSSGDMGTITFTPEEQRIWNGLTDAARKEALEFIRNGGTLKEFVAQ